MSQHLQQENTLTAAKQTMSAWSRLIESRDEIPPIYRKYVDELFDSVQTFPHMIWTPSLEKSPRKTTEKLICDTDDALYVFEKVGNQIETKCYLYRDIHSSEAGIVLLDSWLTVYGKTSQAELTASKIEVNTTSLRYFAGIQRKLRPALDVTNHENFTREKDKFNILSTTHFKFMNYGRESLLPGETVLQFIVQTEIRDPLFTLFGKTFDRDLSPAHLTILTDHELILFQDVERNRDSKISQYGGLWQYIPLKIIEVLELSDVPNDRLLLTIRCRAGRTIEKLFDAASRPEIEQFRSRFQALR